MLRPSFRHSTALKLWPQNLRNPHFVRFSGRSRVAAKVFEATVTQAVGLRNRGK